MAQNRSYSCHFCCTFWMRYLCKCETVARWRYLNILESLKTVVGKEVESDLIWGDVYIGPPPPLRIVFVSLLSMINIFKCLHWPTPQHCIVSLILFRNFFKCLHWPPPLRIVFVSLLSMINIFKCLHWPKPQYCIVSQILFRKILKCLHWLPVLQSLCITITLSLH